MLDDNDAQNDLIGTSRANAASLLTVHARQIKDLVDARDLNSELEALPAEKEIRRRTELGIGLTSPELATLMAHVQLALKDELLSGALPDQEVFADLKGYGGTEWVRVSDEVPVDEDGRDRALESFEARSQAVEALPPDALEEIRSAISQYRDSERRQTRAGRPRRR